MTLSEWIFRALSALLATLAAGMVVFGWWMDTWRGKSKTRRCPRCWYDLSGTLPGKAGNWLCTECGHVESREAHLHRPRRRWRLIASAMPIAMLAGLAWSWPTIHRDGWRATVPTWMIVHFWPIDEVAWMEGRGPQAPMIQELDRRVDHNTASGAELAAWARRVESHYQAVGRGMGATGAQAETQSTGTAPAKAASVLLCVDLSSMFKALAAVDDNSQWDGHRHCINAPPTKDPEPSVVVESAVAGLWLPNTQDSIIGVLRWIVNPDAWLVNGGDDVTYRWSGTSLLVLGPRETLEEIRRSLAGLEEACERSCGERPGTVRLVALETKGMQVVCRDVAGLDVFGLDVSQTSRGSSLIERADGVRSRITENVESETWTDNGGSLGTVQSLGRLLVIQHTPEVQRKIDEYLDTLRAEQSK